MWNHILGVGKTGFYVKSWPDLVGKSFKQVLTSFPKAIPCGVLTSVENEQKLLLNPNNDYVVQHGDEIYVLADGDDYALGTRYVESSV